MNTIEFLRIEIQTNKKEIKSTEQNDTKKKLSNLCLDVAKYIFTGIFLTSIIVLIKNAFWIIIFSGILIVVSILIGIMLNKNK